MHPKDQHLGQAVQHALCALRAKKKMSQEALATRSGLSRQFISYLERQERGLSLESMLHLSHGFGISLVEFTQEIENLLEHYKKNRPVADMVADSGVPNWLPGQKTESGNKG